MMTLALELRKRRGFRLRLAFLPLAFIILAPLPLCGSARAAEIGTAHAASIANAHRIVAIGGSITEIVYALGAEDKLVARDTTSVYPPAALKLPDVGYMRQLSPEGVLSVDPDAVLALEGSGPKEAMDVLEKASVPLLLVPEKFSRDGILEKIRLVGQAVGRKAEAEELAAKVGAAIDEAEAGLPETGKKRVLFVLSLQGGRVLASGSGTAADGIIAMAGGVNAVNGYHGYKQLTDEAIIEARPDVILMMDHAGPSPTDEAILSEPAIAATPAGKAKKLIRMDGAYLLGFGPRTAHAVRDLSTALYGRGS
jgi:iron complex transport system substrate-binding protein